jgi:hypothetical protein
MFIPVWVIFLVLATVLLSTGRGRDGLFMQNHCALHFLNPRRIQPTPHPNA